MIHTKKFATHADYEEFIHGGGTMYMPNVSVCEDTHEVHFNSNGTIDRPEYDDDDSDNYVIHFEKDPNYDGFPDDMPMPSDIALTDPSELRNLVFPYPSTSGDGYYYNFMAGGFIGTTYYTYPFNDGELVETWLYYNSGDDFMSPYINGDGQSQMSDNNYQSIEDYLRENKTLTIYVWDYLQSIN